MVENENVSEVSKDVLAPDEASEGPRENLVSTAVKFLQNPKVQNSPLTQRQLFLEKKGLTKEEIELAIERSGISTNQNETVPHQTSQVLSQRNFPNQQMQPVPYYPVPMTRWEKARSYTSTALILAGFAYAGYYFYKTYIKPLLYNSQENEKRLTNLESKIQEVQSETNELMKQIQESLKSIQYVITQQQIANSSQTTVKQHDLNTINEIKTDIQSLKGLLLNRRQFPPVPSTSPVLPSWQLTPSSSSTSLNNENKNTSEKSKDTEIPVAEVSLAEVSLAEVPVGNDDIDTELASKTSDNPETEQSDNVEACCDKRNTEVPNAGVEDSLQNGLLQTSET